MTRIIGGVAGGRRIAVPPRGTRPTTDRVRESLFNVVTARRDIEGMSVLDLYAGSGALGLEALSRGAASALFVESDRRAAAVLERNIATLGLSGATLRRGQVTAVLAAGAAAPVAPADLVLADPPYDVETADVRRRFGCVDDTRLGTRRNARHRRACGCQHAAGLADWLAPLAAAGLRRHPFRAGRMATARRVASLVMSAAPPHRFALHRRRRAS